MIKSGQDPKLLETKFKKLSKKEKKASEIVDPILAKLDKIDSEDMVAFRISSEGHDTVYNIGHNWSYGMVMNCLDYLNTIQEYKDSLEKRLDRQAKQ